MRAVEITSFGGPQVLALGQRPMPQPGVGELLIRVAASGINRPDVLQRMGHYAPPPGASDLPGLEVAGVESGDAAALAEAGLQVGDRVCALVAGGGYAEWCVAPVAQCLPVPEGLSDVEAASLPETFFTVWSNVFDRGRLQAGETLLVQGAQAALVSRRSSWPGRSVRWSLPPRAVMTNAQRASRWVRTMPSTTSRRTLWPRLGASPRGGVWM